MSKYAEAEERRTKRNDIHVRMIEQAGEDRVLFANTKPQEYVDMRFPEYVLVPATTNLSSIFDFENVSFAGRYLNSKTCVELS
jgi:hypothetical protein